MKLLKKICTTYDRIFSKKYYLGSNNYIYIYDKESRALDSSIIKGLNIQFKGSGNTVILNKHTKFKNCLISAGNNCTISIGQSKHLITNLVITATRSKNSSIHIGNNFSTFGCSIKCAEDKNITIGDDCQCSYGITIWNSDGHAIFDEHGICINHGEDIFIGNHVWLGHNVEILKGAHIPSGCVVGACSLCTKEFTEENTIIAGAPAKVIRHNISWHRKSPDNFK